MLSTLSNILLTFFTSRFERILTATLLTVAQQLLLKGKKTLFMFLSCFVLAILFTAGTIIFVLEASAQYDARGSIFFTALLTSSLIMIAVSTFFLALIFWPRQQTQVVISAPNASAHKAHPLEDILAAAIAEGIEYFKNKSEPAKTRPAEYSQA